MLSWRRSDAYLDRSRIEQLNARRRAAAGCEAGAKATFAPGLILSWSTRNSFAIGLRSESEANMSGSPAAVAASVAPVSVT